MSVDYLLHESSVGYAIFQVIHQPDTVGNRLKEVQDSVQVGDRKHGRSMDGQSSHLYLGSGKVWEDGQAIVFRAFQVGARPITLAVSIC